MSYLSHEDSLAYHQQRVEEYRLRIFTGERVFAAARQCGKTALVRAYTELIANQVSSIQPLEESSESIFTLRHLRTDSDDCSGLDGALPDSN